ncbi:5'-nucleotidase [Klebsiella pneumoniae]|uniref:5'-nucleotidase n=1 Tax=Klebsiella pneumoniae TaxID=573 RepID=A0A377ZTT4_KLEPN|nr:5'-nucleotidase [Klebsiella pneumoniae]
MLTLHTGAIKVGNTLILSTDSGGIDVGKLVLDYQEKPHQFTVKHFELKTLYADEWSLIRRQNRSSTAGISQLDQLVQQVITQSPVELTRAYGISSPLGNLAADALLLAAGRSTQMAFNQLGRDPE